MQNEENEVEQMVQSKDADEEIENAETITGIQNDTKKISIEEMKVL